MAKTPTVSTSTAPFDISQLTNALKGIKVGGDELDVTKLQGKNAQELAELQGKLQKELAAQQNQYNLALQAQQQAGQMALQTGQEQFQSPFMAAQLTGNYNGQSTLAAQQQAQAAAQWSQEQVARGNEFQANLGLQYNQLTNQQNQFNAQQALQAGEFDKGYELDQQKFALQTDISNRQQALAELTQQQQNAIQQGNLDLARQIQTRQLDLQQQNQEAQNRLQTMQTSGYMDNGQLTEAARAARAQEGMQQGALTGSYIDPTTGQVVQTQAAKEFQQNFGLQQGQLTGNYNGQMTDAAQQWRTNAALQAAQTQAQLQANPGDYFQAAAYNRGIQGTGVLNFLPQASNMANGSNVGFRGAMSGLPPTGSMNQIAQGGGYTQPLAAQQQGQGLAASGGFGPARAAGDSGTHSVNQAEQAYQGAQTAYTNSMNVPSMGANQPVAQQQGQQGGQMYAAPNNGQLGMSGQGGPDLAQQRLNSFAPTFQAGAHKLAPGTMEAMSPTERGLFNSAAKASGINPDDFQQAYNRSRLQTNVSANQI